MSSGYYSDGILLIITRSVSLNYQKYAANIFFKQERFKHETSTPKHG